MWLTAVILVFLSLKQEDCHEFKVSPDYRMRAFLRTTKPQVNKNKFLLRTAMPRAVSSLLSPLKSQARF